MNSSSGISGSHVGALIVFAVAAVVSGVFASRDTADAIAFNPCVIPTLTSTDPGAHPDLNALFGIGIGPDCVLGTGDDDPAQANFGGVATFVPVTDVTPLRGDEIPMGAVMFHLDSTARLGLIGNPCSTTIQVSFDMMNASIDPADTIAPIADPPPGIQPLQPLMKDVNPANGLPDGVDHYPAYLNTLFHNPDGSPIQPLRRLTGVQEIQSTNVGVFLVFVVFAPGALANAMRTDTLGNEIPSGLAEAGLGKDGGGYVSVTVLQDPTAPVNPNVGNTISDFCSPLAVTAVSYGVTKDNLCTPLPGDGQCNTTSGNWRRAIPGDTSGGEGGTTVITNPTQPGIYSGSAFVVSQWDADNDNIESSLDPCPLNPDPDWNPRAPGPTGDADQDGLPDSCDPDDVNQSLVGPNQFFDEDQDGYSNRADNCPLVQNGRRNEPSQPIGPNEQRDTDSDGIGDECDPQPTDASNGGTAVREVKCIKLSQSIGGGTTEIPYSPCGAQSV